jgi:hypothetical protein
MRMVNIACRGGAKRCDYLSEMENANCRFGRQQLDAVIHLSLRALGSSL